MKQADRYVVGVQTQTRDARSDGTAKYVVGYEDSGLTGIFPMSRDEADKTAVRARDFVDQFGGRVRVVIYRLVPVRRVRGKRGKA